LRGEGQLYVRWWFTTLGPFYSVYCILHDEKTLYCILHGKSNFLSFNLKSLDCNGVIKNCNSEWKMIYLILLGWSAHVSQALLMSALSSKFPKAVKLFHILTSYFFFTLTLFSLLRLHPSISDFWISHLLINNLYLIFAIIK
jgi:hypothetical protein